jgi:hypothetical protein
LFFPYEGQPSFESLQSPQQVLHFFKNTFPDSLPHLKNIQEEYFQNPTSSLVTVKCEPWVKNNCVLIGDAAHAIVPFYGQGMNAGFEDINTSSGGGQELASLLVKRYTEGAKLLHPCGEFVEDGFYKTLSKHDIEGAPLVVYTMEPIDKMTEDTLCEIRTDDILAAVFFSTRTAENFNHLVKLHGLEDHLQQMQAVCISKNVATALNQDNWQDVIVSDRMNEAALLKSLNRLNG